jgi:hypothetical protein
VFVPAGSFVAQIDVAKFTADLASPQGALITNRTGAFVAALALIASLLLATTPSLRLSFQKVRDGLEDGDRGAASRFWRRLGANLGGR